MCTVVFPVRETLHGPDAPGLMSAGRSYGSLPVPLEGKTPNVSSPTLTIGGHIITRGAVPSVSGGDGLGSNGTVSLSGNDTAGTVAVNVGAGAGAGTLATIKFASNYGNTPKVVINPVGGFIPFYVNRSASGFSIHAASGVPPGGYAFDYIVMQ